MSERFNLERRAFFKKMILGVGASLIFPYLTSRSPLAFGNPVTPLKESDPMATALGYSENANKVDTKKWTKKAAADGKLQKCDSCMFYSAIDKKTGKCQIFPNNTVASQGWCNSWTKKP